MSQAADSQGDEGILESVRSFSESVYEADEVTLVVLVMAEYWHKMCILCVLY